MTLAEKHVDPRVKRTRQLLQQAFPSGQMDAQHGVNQLGVSTSKPEKCTLSKGACPSNVFIRLLRRIERKAFQLEKHALS